MSFRARVALASLLGLFTALPAWGAVFSLRAEVDGLGSVGLNPTNGVYPEGAVVTATAFPAVDWLFHEWSVDATGTTNPLNVQITRDLVIRAVFLPVPWYDFSVAVEGQGVVTFDPPAGPYKSNAVVKVTAQPNAGWVFAYWSGDVGSSDNPMQVSVTSNIVLNAWFAQLPFIDQGPQNIRAAAGELVTFNAHAVGTPPMAYQWWFNGEPIKDATGETLALTNVQASHEGTYSFVASSPYGAATNIATLTLVGECSGTNVVRNNDEAALWEAIEAGGLVRLCFNGTVMLTNTITVTRDVTLDAQDRRVVLSGGGTVRLFEVAPGVHFSATNVVFTAGRHVGRDGAPAGTQPAENGFPGEGGAILNDHGKLSLVSCTFSNNTVIGGRGGDRGYFTAFSVGGDGRGGAISSHGGELWLKTVVFASNCATGGPGALMIQPAIGPPGNAKGGAFFSSNTVVRIESTEFRGNLGVALPGFLGCQALGGAAYVSGGEVTLLNNTLTANSCFGEPAQVDLTSTTRPGGAYGGALAIGYGECALISNVVISNTAIGGRAFRHAGTGEAAGGAVFCAGVLRARDCLFRGNRALSGDYSSSNTDGTGGALHNTGRSVLEGCAIVGNVAVGGAAGAFGSPGADYPAGHGRGGGICNFWEMCLTNCTVAENTARGGAGTITLNGSGYGGGIYSSNGTLTAVSVTIADNLAIGGQSYVTNGFAAGDAVANAGGSFALLNSILWTRGTSGNAWGVIGDAGYNLSSDGTAGFASGSSFNFTDPRLSPLADNGGPTPTMALQENSPAIDFGASQGIPLVDQRGWARPFGAGVDIGAYEFTRASDSPVLNLKRTTDGLMLFIRIPANRTCVLESTGNYSTWAEMQVLGPFTTEITVEVPVMAAGEARFYRTLER